jgi:hypothetical protein
MVPPTVVGLTVDCVTVAVEVKSISGEPPNSGALVLTCCWLTVETDVGGLDGFGSVRRNKMFPLD